jgi:2Fe-2S ferredoxin
VPTVVFLANVLGSEKRVELGESADLVDICDEVLAPVPFSCRSASCATCHIQVIEGEHLLEPAEERELELLGLVDGPPGSRLACQVRVKDGEGVVRVKPVDG